MRGATSAGCATARSPTSRSSAVFTLNALPDALPSELVSKLSKAEPATIGHFRNWGFMDPAIRAMQSDVRIAGPAIAMQDAEAASRKRLDAGEKLPDISGATKMLQEALAKQKS